jgi:penicillin-binding protein 2
MPQIPLRDYPREGRLFFGRAVQAGVVIVLMVGLLLLRYINLQVVEHGHYTTLARENRVKLLPLPPTRGLIYDRNGLLLAQNVPTHSLTIVPEQAGDLDLLIRQLSPLVSISDLDIARFHRLRQQRRRFEGVPLRVHLTPDEVARIAVNQHRFPGVEIEARLLRDYPMAAVTAHVLGYVGRISEQDMQEIEVSNYSGTSHIGKSGVERYHEEALHGRVGVQQVEVNVVGRVIRVLQETPPTPGKDLHLSIDANLQQEALMAFGEEIGAAVAIDPRTGYVLALVSKPGFDPNPFVEGISVRDYQALQEDPDRPLYNRALRGQYPPGSTIKPFMGLAGLEFGMVTASQHKYCPGFYQLPNHDHKFRDWRKGGHGSIDLHQSMVQSCDVYYYDLAAQLGVDRMHEYLARFGFGAPTGIDITGELGGLLPSREWKRRARRAAWFPGETLIMGIGQGYFLATPLQLASATATLAADGRHFVPQVVEALAEQTGAPLERLAPKLGGDVAVVNRQNWHTVADSMAAVMEDPRGTGRRIRSPHYRIAGKTGTAQVFTVKQDEEYDEEKVAKKMRDHALFVAFAPMEDPRIAVAVIVENGGHGGVVAAPIAARIIGRYLGHPLEEVMP